MDIKKVLIFNPFGIGDVLFTTPLIRNLKDNLGEVSVSYLCNRRTYPLLKNNTLLHKIFVFEKDEWRSLAKESKWKFLKDFIHFFRMIKKEKFDVLFDLSLNSQYGFFLKMAGIRMRLGYNFKDRGRFLTHKIDIPQGYSDKHVARYHLSLLKFLNIPYKDYKFDLFLTKKNLQKAEDILKRNNLTEEDLLIGICPGSGDSWRQTAYFRRWPKSNFLKICQWLQSQLKAKIILFGSKGESPLCDYIYDNMKEKPLNLCGKISLLEFCSLMSLCKLIITNDGGPLHIGRALNKKVVIFRGPVSEKVYGVYPDSENCIVLKKDMVCRPCYKGFRFPECPFDKKCLRDISVEETISVVEEFIT